MRLLDWLRGIDYAKYTVLLAYTTDVFSSRVKSLGLPVVCTPLTVPVEGRFWKVFFSWLSYLRQIRADKIIMGDGYFGEWPLATVLAAYLVAPGKVYLTEHTPYPQAPRKASKIHLGFLPGLGLWWYKLVWPLRVRAYLARRVLAVSRQLKEWLVHFYGYPSGKIVVAYRGIDTSRFRRASNEARVSLRASFNIPAHSTVIVSTARLSSPKRIDWLIKAFEALSASRESLWLLLVGDGPLRKELESQAGACSARERIRFTGFLEDVSAPLQASDIFVLASAFEGFGTAILEAMASELVCVVTDTVGPGEVIENSENGFLVQPSDEGVLEGLEKALKLSPAERELMGEKARQTIQERFQFSDTIKKALAMLEIDQIEQDIRA